jgi:WhiB family transcriptional regulator, redox-sensing transcriptional regulator
MATAFHQPRIDDNDTDWMNDPNPCKKNPTIFFPVDGGSDLQLAMNICNTCSNRLTCLEYALRNRIDHGVWGGASERGRRRILKSRRLT